MRNIKLIIAYDGGSFCGWQKTKVGPSIEETLEKVLGTILQEPISLQAASRTDSGVHARGQVVNFITANKRFDLSRLFVSANQLLPKSIVVSSLQEAPASFHPTLDCIGKEYHYSICASPVQLPQHRCYSWHVRASLDKGKMDEAAAMIKGEKNFKALCNAKKNSRYQDYLRELTSIEIESLPEERLCIKILGNHFLYKMARNIAGMIVYAGIGKLHPGDIESILASGDRTQASITAPAHGLTLFRVLY